MVYGKGWQESHYSCPPSSILHCLAFYIFLAETKIKASDYNEKICYSASLNMCFQGCGIKLDVKWKAGMLR